jgi:hypothetical protein
MSDDFLQITMMKEERKVLIHLGPFERAKIGVSEMFKKSQNYGQYP